MEKKERDIKISLNINANIKVDDYFDENLAEDNDSQLKPNSKEVLQAIGLIENIRSGTFNYKNLQEIYFMNDTDLLKIINEAKAEEKSKNTQSPIKNNGVLDEINVNNNYGENNREGIENNKNGNEYMNNEMKNGKIFMVDNSQVGKVCIIRFPPKVSIIIKKHLIEKDLDLEIKPTNLLNSRFFIINFKNINKKYYKNFYHLRKDINKLNKQGIDNLIYNEILSIKKEEMFTHFINTYYDGNISPSREETDDKSDYDSSFPNLQKDNLKKNLPYINYQSDNTIDSVEYNKKIIKKKSNSYNHAGLEKRRSSISRSISNKTNNKPKTLNDQNKDTNTLRKGNRSSSNNFSISKNMSINLDILVKKYNRRHSQNSSKGVLQKKNKSDIELDNNQKKNNYRKYKTDGNINIHTNNIKKYMTTNDYLKNIDLYVNKKMNTTDLNKSKNKLPKRRNTENYAKKKISFNENNILKNSKTFGEDKKNIFKDEYFGDQSYPFEKTNEDNFHSNSSSDNNNIGDNKFGIKIENKNDSNADAKKKKMVGCFPMSKKK